MLNGNIWVDYVVVVSGVWSGMFFKQFGLNNLFFFVKGECLFVWNDDILLIKIFYYDYCYIVLRKSGRLVVGVIMKLGDWSEILDFGGLEVVMKKVKMMFLVIQNMKVDCFWVGLWLGIKDGKLYIGRYFEDSCILFVVGYFRNGILFVLVMGVLIGDFMMNKEVN